MRYYMGLLMTPFLISCAHTPQPVQGPPDLKPLLTSYLTCLTPTIRQTDDGVSDAYTIAKALTGACPSEFDKIHSAMAASLDNNAQRRLLAGKMADEQLNMIAAQVLTVRRDGRPR